MARAAVAALGPYETARGLSDMERRAKDERLGFSVTLLCRAAGVLEHIAKHIVPEWDAARTRALAHGTSCPAPPDLSREVLLGLSKCVLSPFLPAAAAEVSRSHAYPVCSGRGRLAYPHHDLQLPRRDRRAQP